MGDLLEEYKSYYQARMQRYEGSEIYKNSYETEKDLYEAMASCNELIEFKDKIGDLNVKNSIALVKDQALARKKNFEEMKEVIRAQGPAEILAQVDGAKDVNELIRISNDIDQKNMVDISIDGFTDVFYDVFKLIEDVEIGERAIVPDKYKSQMAEGVERDRQAICTAFDDNEKQAHQWQEGWSFDYESIWQERHRRRIPLSDEIVKDYINRVKKFRVK